MDVAAWLAHSSADAERRGLPGLVPLLQTLAKATDALRAADTEFGHSTAEAAEKKATEDTEGKATEHTEGKAAEDADRAEETEDGTSERDGGD